MKIALVFHKNGIPGGHCEYSEYLLKGLRELGHQADYFYISTNTNDQMREKQKTIDEIERNGGWAKASKHVRRYTKGISTGRWYHAEHGYLMPESMYGTTEQARKLGKELDEYDAVIWQDIGGFKNTHNETHTDWVELVQRSDPNIIQIAMFHDHGALLRYPWFDKIQHNFTSLVCVHPASYNMGKHFSIPRCMIFNPQDLSKVDESRNNYHNKSGKTTFSLGAWKGSKKFQELVAAVPWIDEEANIVMGGTGTELRYLKADEKCKDEYIRSKQTDPDCDIIITPENRKANRMWEHAMNHDGFSFEGDMGAELRDAIYADTFLFIDPAWYTVNKEIDAHFSRVIVEAMKNGIVPIARDLGMGTGGGDGSLFKAGENYIMVPWDATPKQFGDIINASFDISEDDYKRIVANNYRFIRDTDYLHVASQFIDVINGTDQPGFYGKWETGQTNEKFKEASDRQWYGDVKGFCFKKPTAIAASVSLLDFI